MAYYTCLMTPALPGGTSQEVLPFTDGSVLTVVTDLATGARRATLDNVAMAAGGDLADLVKDGRSFRGGGGKPVTFDGIPVEEEDIGIYVRRWQGGHPPHEPPAAGGDEAAGTRHAGQAAQVRAMSFRGAHGRGRRG